MKSIKAKFLKPMTTKIKKEIKKYPKNSENN